MSAITAAHRAAFILGFFGVLCAAKVADMVWSGDTASSWFYFFIIMSMVLFTVGAACCMPAYGPEMDPYFRGEPAPEPEPKPWLPRDIVAACQYRDFILIFDRDGTIWRADWDSLREQFSTIGIIHRL